MRYPKIKCENSRKQKLCKRDISKIKTLKKNKVKNAVIMKQFKVSQPTIWAICNPEKHETLKEKIRIINHKRYHNDPEFRERLKSQIIKNHKKRLENDPIYKKWQRSVSKKWQKKHKDQEKQRQHERYLRRKNAL